MRERTGAGLDCSSTPQMRPLIQEWADLGWDARMEMRQRFQGIEVALSRIGPAGCLDALGDLTTEMAAALTAPVEAVELPGCVPKDEGWRCREASKKTLSMRQVEPDRFDLDLYAEHATFARTNHPTIWWPRWVLETTEPHETLLDGRIGDVRYAGVGGRTDAACCVLHGLVHDRGGGLSVLRGAVSTRADGAPTVCSRPIHGAVDRAARRLSR